MLEGLPIFQNFYQQARSQKSLSKMELKQVEAALTNLPEFIKYKVNEMR